MEIKKDSRQLVDADNNHSLQKGDPDVFDNYRSIALLCLECLARFYAEPSIYIRMHTVTHTVTHTHTHIYTCTYIWSYEPLQTYIQAYAKNYKHYNYYVYCLSDRY